MPSYAAAELKWGMINDLIKTGNYERLQPRSHSLCISLERRTCMDLQVMKLHNPIIGFCVPGCVLFSDVKTYMAVGLCNYLRKLSCNQTQVFFR